MDERLPDKDPLFVASFLVLCLICAGLGWAFREKKYRAPHSAALADPVAEEAVAKTSSESLQRDAINSADSLLLSQTYDFARFRKNWLTVYYLVMAGDWLQGPYLFKLYSSYGYDKANIAVLFVTGFLSSAVFGTIAGSVADKIGRKKSCMLCSVVYSAACFIKNINVFAVLVVSHILSGVATSLLFSVYEAWMVAEHKGRGYNSAWLSDTFSWATFGNGIVAMFAGMLADQVCGFFGSYVAPFMVAVLFLALAGSVVASTWVENYGSRDGPGSGPNLMSTLKSIRECAGIAARDRAILAVGGIQAFFETAMYTFVFLWTPSLEATTTNKLEVLPYGTIFASFMVSVMIGSTIFRVLGSHFRWSIMQIARPAFMVATLAMLAAAYFQSRAAIFWSFNVFEACVGVYFPLGGTLRSKHVPERVRATMMTVFRIPLNIMTVVSLLQAPKMDPATAFLLCGILLAVCFGFSLILPEDDSKQANHTEFQPVDVATN